MGINGLDKLIKNVVPQAIHQEPDWSSFRDKVLAVDASLSLFQNLLPRQKHSKTAKGETIHLMGIFHGGVRLLQQGIKPVFVFDGVAANRTNDLAEEVANKYMKKRLGTPGQEEEHTGLLAEAMQAILEGQDVDSGYGNPVKEAKELISMMGIPYLEAPAEAESQCAALVKSGKAYATVTESMDALTFGSDRMIRRLSFKASSKAPVEEIDLEAVLKGFGVNYTEFVDLCILLGCDYCDRIKNISPKKTLELLQKYRSIEDVLRKLNEDKFKIPFFWTTLYPSYDKARFQFLDPVVFIGKTLGFEWRTPDKQAIVDYLCGPKQFNEDAIRKKVNKYLRLIP